MLKIISFKSKIYNKEQETKRVKLWMNEYPILSCNFSNIFKKTFILSNYKLGESKKICIELSLIRHASNYALLGCEYIPSNTSSLQIEIHYNDKNTQKYIDNHLFYKDHKYCGLLEEYLTPIVEEIEKFSQENIIYSGKLIFNVSANCEIGSSQIMFRKATNILLDVLNSGEIDEDEIKRIFDN